MLRDSRDVLLPTITEIVSDSLSSGVFPSLYKQTIANPYLKKITRSRKLKKNTHCYQIARENGTSLFTVLQFRQSLSKPINNDPWPFLCFIVPLSARSPVNTIFRFHSLFQRNKTHFLLKQRDNSPYLQLS